MFWGDAGRRGAGGDKTRSVVWLLISADLWLLEDAAIVNSNLS